MRRQLPCPTARPSKSVYEWLNPELLYSNTPDQARSAHDFHERTDGTVMSEFFHEVWEPLPSFPSIFFLSFRRSF